MDLFINSNHCINGTPDNFDLDITDVYTIQEGYMIKLVGATIPTLHNSIFAEKNDQFEFAIEHSADATRAGAQYSPFITVDIPEAPYVLGELLDVMNAAIVAGVKQYFVGYVLRTVALNFSENAIGRVTVGTATPTGQELVPLTYNDGVAGDVLNRYITGYRIRFRSVIARQNKLAEQLGLGPYFASAPTDGWIYAIDPNDAALFAEGIFPPQLHPDYIDVNINIQTNTFHSGGSLANVIARIPLPALPRALVVWSNTGNEVGQRIQGMHLSSLRIWLLKPDGTPYTLPNNPDTYTSFHFQLTRAPY